MRVDVAIVENEMRLCRTQSTYVFLVRYNRMWRCQFGPNIRTTEDGARYLQYCMCCILLFSLEANPCAEERVGQQGYLPRRREY
jgi:hypothetical protein